MKLLLIAFLSTSWGMDQKLGIVTSGNIGSGAVTTSKLSAGAVTTSKIAASALEPITLDATNGEVGVNVSNPLAKLSVNGLSSAAGFGATDKGILQVQSLADAIGLHFGTYAGSPYPAYIQGGDPRTSQGGTYPLAIQPKGGDVGVGTTNPTAKLEVVGSFLPQIRTKAQIDAITAAVGHTYYCSDCTVPYDICIGTGTALSGFRATINSAINTAVPGTLVPKGCGTNN